MDNKITVNINELLFLPDDSIIDAEIIRQIGLVNTHMPEFPKEKLSVLYRKIKKGFEYSALYPEVIKSFDIKPTNFLKNWEKRL